MTSRERKALATASKRPIIVIVELLQYAVASLRRRDGTFGAPWFVTRNDVHSHFGCTCPKFKRDGRCHHVDAVLLIVNGYEAKRHGAAGPVKRPVYPWDNRRRKTCREAQERLLLPLLMCLLNWMFPVPNVRARGRQRTDLANVVYSVVLRTQYHKSGGLAQSFITSAWEAFEMRRSGSNNRRPPSSESLTKNMRDRRTIKAMHSVIAALAETTKNIGEYAAMDSSEYNLPTLDRSVDASSAPGKRDQQRILLKMTAKRSIIVGVITGMILAARVNVGKNHDIRKARALVKAALAIKTIKGVIADKAYVQTELFEWLADHCIPAIIPPKSNTKRIVNSILGRHATWWFDNADVQRDYGFRQLSETSNSSDKLMNGENLRSKKPVSQATEILGHVALQDLRQVIWLYLNGAIDDIYFMDGHVREQLDSIRATLAPLPRPDLSPRFRDGLNDVA